MTPTLFDLPALIASAPGESPRVGISPEVRHVKNTVTRAVDRAPTQEVPNAQLTNSQDSANAVSQAFDLRASRDARDHALTLVATDEAWLAQALDAIAHVAGVLPTFTVDDVNQRMDTLGIPRPTEGRAMGAAMVRARTKGLIVNTGNYTQSSQKQCHAGPRSVWRKA